MIQKKDSFTFTFVAMGRLLVILFFSTLHFSGALYSQDVESEEALEEPSNLNVLVNAQVVKESKAFQNVDVVLSVDGKTIKQQKTNADGFFELILEFDSLYLISFNKEGYIPKSVEVDTRNILEEDKEMGYDVGMFKVSMSKIVPGVLIGPYKKPMARFIYDPRTQNFVVDKEYKKERKADFQRLKQKELEPIKF
ncbi:MAG: hypothetical protein KDC83_02915 [Flavobacteriales bacterium]|nr:hypothetical protein [Flavobacteriales bacterium]